MNWVDKIKRVRPYGKYSQYGEEAYLNYIFHSIGVESRYYLDIGANDGKWLSNTRSFADSGWDGLMIDGKHENEYVKKHFVMTSNIISLLYGYGVPQSFDLLSIDIDGNDYWVLDAILNLYRPRVIISEFNSEFDPSESKAIKYDPNFVFKGNNYYGYTYEAGKKLAAKHGYKIIHQTNNLNLYYVRADLIQGNPIVGVIKHKWWGKEEETKDLEWVTI